MSDPKNKAPKQDANFDNNVESNQQDAVTNTEESNKVVNQDNVVADTEAIETTLSDSEPSTALNADHAITNNDDAGSRVW
ncbi:hypothetical protein DYU05_13750 [Mucilaginibacter terrenus]|uniref:Uncharacterized protein n=1 Tax=Mucilaginibacter terrenus TaxID=2482727 RepID=A0A3E2NQI6_9SPHI|nr:hypothetical protein [Mucilaginibacter terrenus]RFZ83201.1 hypothetical protein DYU05_13750 [Mucilaginibacter terrenus]